MHKILYHRIDDVFVIYLDAILIYTDTSSTKQDHIRHLCFALEQLQDDKRYVGLDKFELMQTEIEFLALIVDSNEVKVGEERKTKC